MNKIQSFKEFLAEHGEVSEQAIARYGDFPLDMIVTATSAFVMSNTWSFCCDIKTKLDDLQLYKIKSTNLVYIVGKWGVIDSDRVFIRVAEIKLRKEEKCGTVYTAVDIVRVNEEYRGSGIATSMYSALVKHEN